MSASKIFFWRCFLFELFIFSTFTTIQFWILIFLTKPIIITLDRSAIASITVIFFNICVTISIQPVLPINGVFAVVAAIFVRFTLHSCFNCFAKVNNIKDISILILMCACFIYITWLDVPRSCIGVNFFFTFDHFTSMTENYAFWFLVKYIVIVKECSAPPFVLTESMAS